MFLLRKPNCFLLVNSDYEVVHTFRCEGLSKIFDIVGNIKISYYENNHLFLILGPPLTHWMHQEILYNIMQYAFEAYNIIVF